MTNVPDDTRQENMWLVVTCEDGATGIAEGLQLPRIL